MKTAVLITARLKSTRLPYKLLLDLNGKTVIERVIERAKKINNVDEVILCTSDNPQDLPLVKLAKENGIFYYQGSEDDVIQRLYTVARSHQVDSFLSITADNPLFTIYYSERLLDLGVLNDLDFAEVINIPLGMSIYYLKTKALDVICQTKNITDTEFWPVLVKHPDIFSIDSLDADISDSEKYRITLDTENDYKVIRNIYNNHPSSEVLNESDVIEYLRSNPKIVSINANYKRSWLANEMIDRINNDVEMNKKAIIALRNKVYNK